MRFIILILTLLVAFLPDAQAEPSLSIAVTAPEGWHLKLCSPEAVTTDVAADGTKRGVTLDVTAGGQYQLIVLDQDGTSPPLHSVSVSSGHSQLDAHSGVITFGGLPLSAEVTFLGGELQVTHNTEDVHLVMLYGAEGCACIPTRSRA